MTELQQGIYYLLITKLVKDQIVKQNIKEKIVTEACTKEQLVDMLAFQAGQALKHSLLKTFEQVEACDKDLKYPEIVQKVLSECLSGESLANCIGTIRPADMSETILKEVKLASNFKNTPRPFSDINETALITPRDLRLGSQIQEELSSCDRADWLVSFIKLSAIRGFYEKLKAFCSKPNPDGTPRLRIATTTYMGISDPRAFELLLDLPNTEIRVAYENTQRHHAKAYLFYRKTGFSTAYVGSANLSTSAMTEGLEWTVKFPEMTMPDMWKRSCAAFEENWMNQERFKKLTKEQLPELRRALREADPNRRTTDGALPYFVFSPHQYQRIVLDAIERERANNDSRHLVVAATGTGKTMIAAFDYKRLCEKEGGHPPLLFIAHRKDILQQAIKTYRAVLRDTSFGEVIEGPQLEARQHFFCTIASWKSHLKEQLPKNYFRAIVVDECHHAQANTYVQALEYYSDVINRGETDLTGLTATPDREDGKDIRQYFNGKITYEISLSDAINNRFLVPFDYFAIADNTDFSPVRWGSATADNDVQKIVEGNITRAQLVYNAVLDRVDDLHSMRAIGFCAGINHAELMKKVFAEKGIKSAVLTGASSSQSRTETVKQLTTSESENRINVIFVADLFNEGVDIPEVDTLFMLRPTDSATIFTQQLGRGLRLADKKDNVLVLDFVAGQNGRFNGATKFNVLTSRRGGVTRIKEQIEHDMPFLPAGCSVSFDRVAKEDVLKNLNAYVARLRGRQLVNAVKQHISEFGRSMSVDELMKVLGIDSPNVLYKNGILPRMISDEVANNSEHDDISSHSLGKFLLRVAENDNPEYLSKWSEMLNVSTFCPSRDEEDRLARFNLITSFDTAHVRVYNADEYWKQFYQNPALIKDVQELIQWRKSHILPHLPKKYEDFSLRLHCRYNRNQICAALGRDGATPMSGILRGTGQLKKYSAFFVTRNKENSGFSMQTMYKDFAITESVFQWESQHMTKADSQEVKDYISGARIPLLFLQEEKETEDGIIRSFVFLGKMNYLSHEKECPVQFKFELETSMPSDVFSWASA